MNLWMFLKQGFSSILANKLRSILSVLGIVIGISSVVIMLAIGEGAKKNIMESFNNADGLITIEKRYIWGSEIISAPGGGYSFEKSVMKSGREVVTMEVAETLKEKVFGIKNVAYSASVGNGNIIYNSKNIYVDLLGISSDYFLIKGYKVKDGTYFSNNNYKNNDKVIILGSDIVKENFGKENAIGKIVSIHGTPFIVQGVLEDKNRALNYTAFIPINTAINRLGTKDLSSIEVLADERLDVNGVKIDLQYYLFKFSGLSSPSKTPFSVRTNEDILKQIDQIVGQMKLLLGAIGSIALIVGGIGIMNIMLVSVTERTREIGIRKAIGATKTNILFQFLIESVILSIIGCIVAVTFCYGVTYLISQFVGIVQAEITSSVLVMASSVSVGMGIIFGLMPAWKAARLKPIDALRFE